MRVHRRRQHARRSPRSRRRDPALARALGKLGRRVLLARASRETAACSVAPASCAGIRRPGRSEALRRSSAGCSRASTGDSGYATEAALALRDWALGERGLTRLISLIQHGNVRLFPRCGEARRALRTGRGGSRQAHAGSTPSSDDRAAPARRHARRRRHVLARRAVGDAAARRARRRRRQGGAARGRPRPRLGTALRGGRRRDVPRLERGQALPGRRPRRRPGPRRRAASGRPRRRVRPEPPAGRGGAARPRRCRAAGAQPAARLLLDRRVRLSRPAQRPARLRPAAAGRLGDHERDRRGRPPAGARRACR